jgi:ketosteroid isomerase-like protein
MHEQIAPVDVVTALYEALGRGDVPALVTGLAPDIAWVEPEGLPYGGTYHGRDAVLNNVFACFPTEWDDLVVDPAEIVPAGDVVFALGHYRGRSRATGKAMVTRFVHVWRLHDGVPVHFETVMDTYTLRAAAQS